jgi:hypothetical protein
MIFLEKKYHLIVLFKAFNLPVSMISREISQLYPSSVFRGSTDEEFGQHFCPVPASAMMASTAWCRYRAKTQTSEGRSAKVKVRLCAICRW